MAFRTTRSRCSTGAASAILLLTATISLGQEAKKPQAQYIYKTVGDRQLAIQMSYPPDWKATDKRSAIVFFFGGGWTSGTTEQFRPQAEYFARRGLVCGRADYRVKSRDGVTPAECVEDALSAMRWVRGHAATLGIDPSRIVSSGGSAGGHLAACVFFTEGIMSDTDDPAVSPRPNAMILYNPALDFVALKNSGRGNYARSMDDDTLARISPLRHVRKEMPPTLILDGTNDFLYDQNHAMVEKGKQLGAPIEVFWAEGQRHGFFNRSPWLEKTTERADQFLQSRGYLGGKPVVALPHKEPRQRPGN